MNTISRIISVGIDVGLEAAPLKCIGLGGYLPQLVFWVIAPAVIVLVILLLVLIGTSVRRFYLRRHRQQESGVSIQQTIAPVILYVLFLLCAGARVQPAPLTTRSLDPMKASAC